MFQKRCAGTNASGSGLPAPGLLWRRRGRRVHRALDLLVAGRARVALGPVYLLVAIRLSVGSGGPVFVTQIHTGRNGRRCSIPKFRTTYAGGRPQLHAVSTHAATPNDPRRTRLGRFLHRAGLDELPALWSVFVGDLSLLGPRPLV